ncbi:hypothetical protein FBU30_004498 [Linnemannia zychae]|nr:hypothetical protein FBU30_004498 [Linnemannia zychae]
MSIPTPIIERFSRAQLFGILNRISFPLSHLPPDTLPPPTLETLKELQIRFVTTVPFETLSLRTTASRIVDISLEGIYNRVVVQKRGGWCFSLNRLGFELLVELGFRAQTTIGRVCKPRNHDDPLHFTSKGHRISIVRFLDEVNGTDTKYLFDIGFGNSTQIPLELKAGAIVEFSGHKRRISTRTHIEETPDILGNPPFIMWCLDEYLSEYDTWVPCYVFSEQQFYEIDCASSNYYTSLSPESVFFKSFWCIRSTLEGNFIMIIQKSLIIKNAKGHIKKIKFHKEQDHLDALKEYFGIELTEDELRNHDSWIIEAASIAETIPEGESRPTTAAIIEPII